MLAKRGTTDVGNDARADFASAGVDDGHDRLLVRVLAVAGLDRYRLGAGAVVLVLGVATDPRLIPNDGADHGGNEGVGLHGFTNPVAHEPRRTGAHVVLALDFTGGDAVLVGAHLEHDQHPHAKRRLRALKHRSRQHRELLAAGEAAPYPPLCGCTRPSLAGNTVRRLNEGRRHRFFHLWPYCMRQAERRPSGGSTLGRSAEVWVATIY